MPIRRVTAPLHVTERVDYALRAVLLLSLHEGQYVSAKAVADHYGISQKMLAGVLRNLSAAGILESRAGWHGGVRLAHPPGNIALHAVIAATGSAVDGPQSPTRTSERCRRPTTSDSGADAGRIVDGFWRSLDDHLRTTLKAFSVADLARARPLT